MAVAQCEEPGPSSDANETPGPRHTARAAGAETPVVICPHCFVAVPVATGRCEFCD